MVMSLIHHAFYLFWPCSVHSFQHRRTAYDLLFSLDVVTFNTNCTADSQTIDVSTMTFPAEMLVDYVRVYQREDQVNVGCDPPDYPTANYINSHHAAYNSLSCSRRRFHAC